jgi:hypothetical protein
LVRGGCADAYSTPPSHAAYAARRRPRHACPSSTGWPIGCLGLYSIFCHPCAGLRTIDRDAGFDLVRGTILRPPQACLLRLRSESHTMHGAYTSCIMGQIHRPVQNSNIMLGCFSIAGLEQKGNGGLPFPPCADCENFVFPSLRLTS